MDGHCTAFSYNEKLKTVPPNQKELGLKKKNPDKVIEETENVDQDLSPKKALGHQSFTREFYRNLRKFALFIFKLFQNRKTEIFPLCSMGIV